MRPFRYHDLLSLPLLTLSLLARNVYAIGITFTTPGAGATWPPGGITVSWTDAGGNPDMSQLSTYVLQLIVGGNQADDSTAIATIGSPGAHVGDGNVQDEIAADIAQSIENGFYFKMTSNTTDGNSQVINYSDRFTLISMKGTTAPPYLNGANSAEGANDVPEAQLNNNFNPSPSASSSASPLATTTATATATATASPPPPPGPGGKDNAGISTGEKVAIGVGGALAIIGLASLFGWAYVFYRHKKRKQHTQRHSQMNPPSPSARAFNVGRSGFIDDKAELPGRPTSGLPAGLHITRERSPQTERLELPDFGKPVEAARASLYELEGDVALFEAGHGRKSKAYDPLDM